MTTRVVGFASDTTIQSKQPVKRDLFGNIVQAEEIQEAPIPIKNYLQQDTKAHKYVPPRPFYEDIIISLSFIAFMVYFCALREENDVDEQLDMPLDETLRRARLSRQSPGDTKI